MEPCEATVKKRVRRRDGHRCTKCGMTEEQHQATFRRSLEVHRVNPGSQYTVAGCVTLCMPCHKRTGRKPHFRITKDSVYFFVPFGDSAAYGSCSRRQALAAGLELTHRDKLRILAAYQRRRAEWAAYVTVSDYQI